MTGRGRNPTLAIIVVALIVLMGVLAYTGWRGTYRTPRGMVVPSSTAPGAAPAPAS